MIRSILPAGFFANRVVDLQAFTAAVFLLLAGYRSTRASSTFLQAVDVNVTSSLVDQVARLMGVIATRTGGDFACQASEAIRALSTLLTQPQTSEMQEIILSLPLGGRIHVSRKSYTAKTISKHSYSAAAHVEGIWPTHDGGPAPNVQELPLRSSDENMIGSLSYSMEIPESYPFFTDEAFGAEQWLSWTGWNGQI
jgi:hypothetical protein